MRAVPTPRKPPHIGIPHAYCWTLRVCSHTPQRSLNSVAHYRHCICDAILAGREPILARCRGQTAEVLLKPDGKFASERDGACLVHLRLELLFVALGHLFGVSTARGASAGRTVPARHESGLVGPSSAPASLACAWIRVMLCAAASWPVWRAHVCATVLGATWQRDPAPCSRSRTTSSCTGSTSHQAAWRCPCPRRGM